MSNVLWAGFRSKVASVFLGAWPLLAVILVANATPLIIAHIFELGRPWLNADYLLVGVLVLTRFRLLALLILPVMFAIDVVALVSQVFPISRLSDAVYLLKFAAYSSVSYRLLLLAAFVCLFAVTWAFSRVRTSETRFKTALVLLNLGLLVYVVEVYTQRPGEEMNRLWRMQSQPLAYSQSVSYYTQSNTGFWQTLEVEGEAFSSARPVSRSELWMGAEPSTLNRRILLIVSESWGVPRDPNIQEAITAPVTNLHKQLEWLDAGSFQFQGATIAGELRELCKLFPVHFNMGSVTDGFESCLPNRLKAHEYETHALHGAAGIMYDRVKWYPRVGFDYLTFFETHEWPARCYSFPGACDIDMMDQVEQRFTRPGKQFVYWLTLNSHSIYDERDIRFDVFDCSKYGVTSDSQSCRNLKLHGQFFYKLAELLKRPSMSGIEVLIVGDHAPPIFGQAEKEEYFIKDEVAWLHFKLR